MSFLKDWSFIARFCYLSQDGAMTFNFEYPQDACCQEIILYFDDQWPHVYPHPEMTCKEKVAVTIPKNNQIMNLDLVSNSNCSLHSQISDQPQLKCYGRRAIKASRARWWYIVVAKCQSKQGLSLKYSLEMTNGNSFWTKQFSADEANILQTEILFLILSILVFLLTIFFAFLLRRRQLLHTTYKMFLGITFFELVSVIFNVSYYTGYGFSGKPQEGLQNFARGMHCVGDLIFVVLCILLGKGFTVTRGKISSLGQVKLSVFTTLYAITYIVLFIYQTKSFDPGYVLYLYESPAGVGVCMLRVIAWVWFCYGIYFSLKNYPHKRLFYYPFWLFYTLWFLSGPLVVLLASYVFEPYMRAQVMNAVDRTIAFMASVFFLVLTRPSQANTNFPYHVRTSQIGIMENNNPSDKENFDQHMYAPTIDLNENQKITVLFSVIKSDLVESDSREIKNLVNSNQTQNQIFAYNEYPQYNLHQLHHQNNTTLRSIEGSASANHSPAFLSTNHSKTLELNSSAIIKFGGLNHSLSSSNKTDGLYQTNNANNLHDPDKYQTSIFQALGAPQISNDSLHTKSEDIFIEKGSKNSVALESQNSDQNKFIEENHMKDLTSSKFVQENQEKDLASSKFNKENLDKNLTSSKFNKENLDKNLTSSKFIKENEEKDLTSPKLFSQVELNTVPKSDANIFLEEPETTSLTKSIFPNNRLNNRLPPLTTFQTNSSTV
ncbi:transmembrane protein 145 isoform X4 [Hydra vulgaris]|uniref:Transmembrane protein 145 isoform X4 n=1 Tax=Hydra vulgaris TaxID=6087 RepID=A0ABM4B6J7_HYDVU